MIKAILLDAGGVLYLNKEGVGYINPPLIEFIKANQNRYIFGVISTTEYDLVDILKRDKIDSLFKCVLTSGQTGIDKTDVLIYKTALDKLSLEPKETIFIDNEKDYLTPASSIGINTILYERDFDSCLKSIERFVLSC